jgi:Tol biopolymer transport system component/DNA-binding winged helix-turn-helix (wHTH) protein
MAPEAKVVYEFGPFRLDAEDGSLTRDGQPVHLPPKAVNVLVTLLEAPGSVVSREDLSQKAWGPTTVGSAALDYQIYVIRQALGEGTGGQRYVETLRQRGFRFTAPVRKVSSSAKRETAVLDDERGVSERISGAPEPERAEEAKPPSRRNRRVAWIAALAVLVCVALWLARIALQRSAPLVPVGALPYTQLTHDNQAKDFGPLFQVGSRIYFTRGVGKLAWVATEGGETTEVSQDLSGLTVLDVSTVRSEYLAKRIVGPGAIGELWVAPMLAGPAQRVGNVVCDFAAWSPDGSRIAYTMDTDLFVVNRDGTAARKLATLRGEPAWPKWSPDGTRLRFTVSVRADRDVTHSLWEIGADGTGLRELLKGWNDPPRECCGIWTPDGKYFVFQSRRAWKVDLWLMPERPDLRDRPLVTRLTTGPLSFFAPAPSTDATKLFAFGVHDRGQLVRYDSKAGDFVPYLGGMSATWVSFSRDGARVGYLKHPEGTLWVAKIDQSESRQLTFPPLEVDGWSWSPDARWIALRGRLPRHRTKIYLMPADGGEPRPISSEDVEQGLPTWSPDGKHLVFGEVPEVFGQPTGTEVIHLYDVERREFSVLPDSKALWTSRWSPDGRYISALTIIGQQMMLFDFTTRTWRSLGADHVNQPTWSRDGRYIYYDTEGRTHALRRVRISDGLVDELVNLETFPRTTYWWSGLALDDSPIILRNIGATEVYALHLAVR